MSTPPPIQADDEETWPEEALELLEEGLESILACEAFDRDLERRYQEEGDLKARFNPPPNPHEDARETLLDQLQVLLEPFDIVGYHCTRLLDQEALYIKQHGLTPLSHELVRRRLDAAVQAGHLNQQTASELYDGALLDEAIGRRLGMTWFVFCRNTLREEHGLYRFFKYWGGEAVYVRPEHQELGQKLASFGTPSIVVTSVPIAGLQTFCPIAERMLRVFIAHRNLPLDHDHEFEGHVQAPVRGTRILQLLTPRDDEFERLTCYSTWRH